MISRQTSLKGTISWHSVISLGFCAPGAPVATRGLTGKNLRACDPAYFLCIQIDQGDATVPTLPAPKGPGRLEQSDLQPRPNEAVPANVRLASSHRACRVRHERGG